MTSNPFYQVANVQYISPVNTELVGKALAAKQQKFDLGVEQIQTMYSQLSNIDLSREVDKKYLADRLNLIKQEVGKLGNVDLSKRQNTATLTNYMTTAIDDVVMAGAQGTKVRRRIEEQAEEARKKGKGDYDPNNVAYSLKDVAAWESRGELGEYYRGNKEYVPYFDRTKLHKEVYDKLTPQIQFVSKVGGVDTYMYKNERVSGKRIKEILEGELMLNPKYAQQLQVDAWNTYRGADNNTIKTNLFEQKQKEYKDIDIEVETLRRAFNIEKNKDRRAQLGEKLKQGEDYRRKYKANLDSFLDDFNRNPEAYRTELFKNQVLDGLRAQYEVNNVTDIKQFTNSAALARLKSDLRIKENVLQRKDTDISELDKLIVDGEFEKADRLANILDTRYQTKQNDFVNYVGRQKLISSRDTVTDTDIEGKQPMTSVSQFDKDVQEIDNLEKELRGRLNIPTPVIINESDFNTYLSGQNLSPEAKTELKEKIRRYNTLKTKNKKEEDIITQLVLEKGKIRIPSNGKTYIWDGETYKVKDEKTWGETFSSLGIGDWWDKQMNELNIKFNDLYVLPQKNKEEQAIKFLRLQNNYNNKIEDYKKDIDFLKQNGFLSDNNKTKELLGYINRDLSVLGNNINKDVSDLNNDVFVAIARLEDVQTFAQNIRDRAPQGQDKGEFFWFNQGFKDATRGEMTRDLIGYVNTEGVPPEIKESFNQIVSTSGIEDLIPLNKNINLADDTNKRLYINPASSTFNVDLNKAINPNIVLNFNTQEATLNWAVEGEKKKTILQEPITVPFEKATGMLETYIIDQKRSLNNKVKLRELDTEIKQNGDNLSFYDDGDVAITIKNYDDDKLGNYQLVFTKDGIDIATPNIKGNDINTLLESMLNEMNKINKDKNLSLKIEDPNNIEDYFQQFLR